MKIINYGGQFIDSKDKKSVNKILFSNYLTTGPAVKEFENATQKYLNCKYSLSCSSGTAALHLSILSLGLKKKSNIIMPCINFISSFNICKNLGYKIYLADVDPSTGQMTPNTLMDCIKKNKIKKVHLVITMFLGGYAENIPKFFYLKKKYNFKIIEDSCHAFGSTYKNQKKVYKVGSCKHSDISTFSFHPLKTITTGEGGLITTNSKNIFNKAQQLRSHGILRNLKGMHWKYDVVESGYNYRLSDINCILGLSQLKKINRFIKKRKSIYYYYKNQFKSYSNIISFPKYENFSNSSYHLVIVQINFNKIKKKKDNLIKYLKSKGIIVQYHYIPLYKFKIAKSFPKKFKNSEKYYKNSISLPIYFKLDKNNLKKIVKEIKSFIHV
tara:strand:+ start:622 stop:1773 length:1152 start_codon:yes stop_codon:yes gene_type:complete